MLEKVSQFKFKKDNWCKYVLLVIFVFIIPLVIFSYRLDKNPPGFFIDEAIYGFEAYSLIHTKGRSSTGEFLPRLFLNPGESVRNHSIYTYFVIPSILMLGLNEIAVRLTTVIFSICLLGLIALLMKERVGLPSIVFGIFWWPLSSWVFLLSRIGMEFIPAAFFYLTSIYLLTKLYIEKKQKKLFRLVFIIGITTFFLFFIYAAGKILSLGLMAITILILLKKRAPKRIFYLTGILFLIPFALSLPYIFDHSFFYRVDELLQCKSNILFCFTHNIATHFSYVSYFVNTYLPSDFPVPTHSITGTSLIPRILLPFLLIGILVLIKKALCKDFFSILLFIAFFLGIIPASLTIRGFDSYRSVAILPLLFIAIIFGFDQVYMYVHKFFAYLFPFLMIVFLSITILSAKQELNYLLHYEYETQSASYSGWQYGYKQIFTYFTNNYSYDKLVVTDTIAYLPNLYLRFFDPDHKYGKIHIGRVDYHDSRKILYASRPNEVMQENFIIKHIIYYPNNRDIAFFIGEIK